MVTEVEHIYAHPSKPNPEVVVTYYTERFGGAPFVVHDHLRGVPCSGNCPIYNAPNEDE